MTFDLNSEFGQVVKKHLEKEYFIWFTTVDAKGMPQPRPVWFIWEETDASFLIFSQPGAYKIKHLKDNPNVSLHFNTADKLGENDVIVFTGQVEFDEDAPLAHNVPAYFKKYKDGIAGLKMTPAEFSNEYSTTIRIKPMEVRGWV